MRIVIDTTRCQGHARCVSISPEAFDIDDDGMAFALIDRVPEDFSVDVKSAVAACPEAAIELLGD